MVRTYPDDATGWSILARRAPDRAVVAWSSVSRPDHAVVSAFALGAVQASDRRLWEFAATAASRVDVLRLDLTPARIRLEGLLGRPDRALGVFGRLAAWPDPAARADVVALALSLAAAGQATGVVAALADARPTVP